MTNFLIVKLHRDLLHCRDAWHRPLACSGPNGKGPGERGFKQERPILRAEDWEVVELIILV